MQYEQFFAPVLVVDDEPLVLRQLCAEAKAAGYFDVRRASTFLEAREILQHTLIGLLVSDVALPDGDGRRLAMDALKLNPQLHIVLISGFPALSLMLGPELRERAHLLEKPFGLQQLRSILLNVFENDPELPRIRA